MLTLGAPMVSVKLMNYIQSVLKARVMMMYKGIGDVDSLDKAI